MVGRKRGRGEEEEISLDCDNGHPMVLVPKEVRTSCLARIDTSMNMLLLMWKSSIAGASEPEATPQPKAA